MDATARAVSGDTMSVMRPSPTGQQEDPEEALVGAALACVRWDESVDLDRLMTLEFEHNFSFLMSWLARLPHTARRFVQKMECMIRRPSGESVEVTPHDPGMWSLDNGERMTDAQLAGLLAVCARHTNFWLTLSDTETVCFAQSWMSCVVDGLARQQSAWAGTDIMRTRNLCVALAALVDARERGGPLARVDAPKSGPFDQGAMPPDRGGVGDDLTGLSMREALTAAHRLVQTRLDFRGRRALWEPANRVSAFGFTRRLLTAVQSAVERLYATEPVYVQMIAPAEYDAMISEGALGAVFFH